MFTENVVSQMEWSDMKELPGNHIWLLNTGFEEVVSPEVIQMRATTHIIPYLQGTSTWCQHQPSSSGPPVVNAKDFSDDTDRCAKYSKVNGSGKDQGHQLNQVKIKEEQLDEEEQQQSMVRRKGGKGVPS